MPNQRRKNKRQHSILELIVGDSLNATAVGIILLTVPVILLFSLGMTSVVLLAAFVTYGFSNSLLLFLLLVVTVTTAAHLSGTVPIVGTAFYWFVLKDPILAVFHGNGLEHSLLATLITWGGLATSMNTSISSLLYIASKKHGEKKTVQQRAPQEDINRKSCDRKNSAWQKPSQQNTVGRRRSGANSPTQAEERFCLAHLPIFFSHWERSELKGLEFDHGQVGESDGQSLDFELLKKGKKQFEQTLDQIERYCTQLGRIRFEQDEPCIELVRRDIPRPILYKKAFVSRLFYKITFEQQIHRAVIFKVARVQVITIRQRDRVKLLSLQVIADE